VVKTFNNLSSAEQSDLCQAWDLSHAMAYRELGPTFYRQGFSRYDTKRGIYVAFTRVC
jgi:hypothetical protein